MRRVLPPAGFFSLCEFIFVHKKKVIPAIRWANPPKLVCEFTTCTTQWHPNQTNIHTLRSLDVYRETSGQRKVKEEELSFVPRTAGIFSLYFEAVWPARAEVRHFKGVNRGRGSRHGRHCTAHVAHSVTKYGRQKCIEEQSSSISSKAQCQSWRLKSSDLKGEIRFHFIVPALMRRWWWESLTHRTGLTRWDTENRPSASLYKEQRNLHMPSDFSPSRSSPRGPVDCLQLLLLFFLAHACIHVLFWHSALQAHNDMVRTGLPGSDLIASVAEDMTLKEQFAKFNSGMVFVVNQQVHRGGNWWICDNSGEILGHIKQLYMGE